MLPGSGQHCSEITDSLRLPDPGPRSPRAPCSGPSPQAPCAKETQEFALTQNSARLSLTPSPVTPPVFPGFSVSSPSWPLTCALWPAADYMFCAELTVESSAVFPLICPPLHSGEDTHSEPDSRQGLEPRQGAAVRAAVSQHRGHGLQGDWFGLHSCKPAGCFGRVHPPGMHGVLSGLGALAPCCLGRGVRV